MGFFKENYFTYYFCTVGIQICFLKINKLFSLHQTHKELLSLYYTCKSVFLTHEEISMGNKYEIKHKNNNFNASNIHK